MENGSSRSVPQELADIIIDHLHDDPQSLQHCSFVCKAWEPSSALHLFSRFSWPPCNVYWVRPAVRGVCDCPLHTLTFEDCHDFFLSSPRVRKAVNHLRITGLRTSRNPSVMEENEPLPLTFLFALPELLPGLQRLDAWNLRFGAGIIGPPPRIVSEAGPRSLTKLVLTGTAVLWDDRAIFSILSTFSHIDTVVFECHCEEGLQEDIPFASQVHRRFTSTSVHRLEVSYPPFLSHVLLRLREQRDTSALREVDVQYYLDEGLKRLIASAPLLEVLTFMTSDKPPRPPNPDMLRVLDMTCSIVAGDPEVQPNAPQFGEFGWGEMIRNLDAFRAHELRELTLGVMLRELGCWGEHQRISQNVFDETLARRLREEDWGTFRAVMKAHPKLRKLKVKLIVSGRWTAFHYMVPYLVCSARTFQDAVEACLGRDNSRSILEVVAEHHHMVGITNYYRYP
ncbi:hypothetical protein PsYK624_120990 [Phanerochaete sordida]|uniref:F-box domain-containing protein n=1 Tax=Phanerochaete sordida TaxID=48140 RepID=A0A9P3LIA0_9APHY|nr:hypothetical protein PsYK624_120990 [Phanerochaete sordida]